MKQIFKQTAILVTTISTVALPITAVISCGRSNNDTYSSKVVNYFNQLKELGNKQGSLTVFSRPSTNSIENNKIIIRINASTKEHYDNGDWKTKEEVRGASQQALVDLINNFNDSNTENIKIKLTNFDKVNDIMSILSAKNTPHNAIPNIIFSDKTKLIKLEKFRDVFKNIDNSNNKLGFLSSIPESKNSSLNFLPYAEETLVGVIDYKLINGLIYSYNKYLNKLEGTKIYSDNYDLIDYTTNPSDYTSTGGPNFNGSKTLMNIHYTSKVFGERPLSYERLAEDLDLWIKIKEVWPTLNTGVNNPFGSDFNAQLIYADATMKNNSKPLFENDEIKDAKKLDLALKDLSGNYKPKTTESYISTEFTKANLMLDITKGYSLNYILSNKNLMYMATPGFNYHSEKGFVVIKGDSENQSFNAAIDSFFEYLYQKEFTNESHILSGASGETHRVGVASSDFNKLSPSSYYSLWSKFGSPTSRGQREVLANPELSTMRSSHRTKNIFDIYARTNGLNIETPYTYYGHDFIESINTIYLRGINA